MTGGVSLSVQEDDLPGTLAASDLRIPDDVRARFSGYREPVASVIPVAGKHREEWWLFTEHGMLVDVLVRRK